MVRKSSGQEATKSKESAMRENDISPTKQTKQLQWKDLNFIWRQLSIALKHHLKLVFEGLLALMLSASLLSSPSASNVFLLSEHSAVNTVGDGGRTILTLSI